MKPHATSKGEAIASPESDQYGHIKHSASKTGFGCRRMASGSDEKEMGPKLNPAFCMKVILAPTDLSVESRPALNYALYLAGLVGAQLTLVHFYDESGLQTGSIGTGGYESMLKEERALQNKLYSLRDEIRTVHLNCSSHFYIGDPVKEIPKVAKELKADLIVVSTHDPHGAFSQIFGSDAEKILCHASCPVLIVRQELAQPDLESRESKADEGGFGL
jgi:universal stress protein A